MSARVKAIGVGSGAVIGTLGGLMGLGGAEFRLPVLVGMLGWQPKAAVPINLTVSFIVLLAALPARASAVAWADIAPYLPEMLGMIAGSMTAAFVGAGLLKHFADALLAKVILVLLVALGLVMIGDAFLGEGMRLVAGGEILRAAAGAACGIVIGMVSSLLGVAGGELIIPAFVLGFGVPMKVAGSMSMLVGLPTIAAGLVRHAAVVDGPLRRPETWNLTVGPMGAGSIAGAVLGGIMLGMVPADWLKMGLGVILIWSAFRTFSHLKH
jgi:uncharacterized protein